MSAIHSHDDLTESAVTARSDEDRSVTEQMAADLFSFLNRHRTIAVLTGAGCSTESGIPDYRDDAGNWKNRKPMQFASFVSSADAQRRYWARSFAGWHRISNARPNSAHTALAELEQAGRINCLITQNVDGLHRAAGSRNVIELHGILDRVRCLDCRGTAQRRDFQERLAHLNPDWNVAVRKFEPDGDAELVKTDASRFSVPYCSACGGILKPDVVFFGEAVPGERVRRAAEFLHGADALLIVGSSLMVFSGFRFVRMAHAAEKPIAIVNRGTTRADSIATLKLTADCGELLTTVVDRFTRDISSNARRMDRCL
jgi:NAD-dependent SIR2 family protein deacetylase